MYLSPANGAIDLALNTSITWAAGPGGGNPDYYIVYFGETPTPPQIATNVTATHYAPSLLPERTYYWKVDAVNDLGTAAGVDIWSFDTRADDTIMEFPYTESFEDGNTNGSTTINRWSQALGSGSYYWTANTSTNYNREPKTGSYNLTLRDGGDAGSSVPSLTPARCMNWSCGPANTLLPEPRLTCRSVMAPLPRSLA